MTTIGTANITVTRDAEIGQGLRQLVQISGQNSKDHGFHDDWPKPPVSDASVAGTQKAHEWHQMQLRRAIAEKLALIHEEVSEMLGEIRSGRDPLEIYFVDRKGAVGEKDAEYPCQAYGEADRRFTFGVQRWEDDLPLLKPEGFLVEAADAIIRIADLAFLVNGSEQLVEAQRIKHEYNSTRPHKHGRKF